MHEIRNRWTRRAGVPAVVALALMLSACRPQPAPAPAAPPAPPTKADEPPPPPPPPKCESAEENCKADEQTQVEIDDSGIGYAPPLGWVYVRGSDHARASEPAGAAVVGFALTEADTPAAVLAAVEKLAAVLSLDDVKLTRLKKRLKKPQQKIEFKGGEIELWEINKATQAGKAPSLRDKGKGTALLALARVATERVVVVLGFVVEPDEQGQAGLIMKSVQSLAVMP